MAHQSRLRARARCAHACTSSFEAFDLATDSARVKAIDVLYSALQAA